MYYTEELENQILDTKQKLDVGWAKHENKRKKDEEEYTVT